MVETRKKECTKRDSNPRVRTHYGLNVTPWTTRASVLFRFFQEAHFTLPTARRKEPNGVWDSIATGKVAEPEKRQGDLVDRGLHGLRGEECEASCVKARSFPPFLVAGLSHSCMRGERGGDAMFVSFVGTLRGVQAAHRVPEEAPVATRLRVSREGTEEGGQVAPRP